VAQVVLNKCRLKTARGGRKGKPKRKEEGKNMIGTKGWFKALAAALLVLLPMAAGAIQVKSPTSSALDDAAMVDPSLRFFAEPIELSAAQAKLPSSLSHAWQTFQATAGKGSWQVFVDQVSGLPTLVSGQGMRLLTMPRATVADADAAVQGLLDQHAAILNGVSPKELVLNTTASKVIEEGRINLVYDWYVNDVPVEGALLVARFVKGNLIQFGAEGISPITVRPIANISADAARETILAYAGGFDDRSDVMIDEGSLHLVPARVSGDSPFTGSQFGLKLLYHVTFRRAGELGTFRGRVDAETGALLEFADINSYGTIKGGVYPGSANGKGTEINIPLGFANYGSGTYANNGGIYTGTTGTTTLAGKYVKMNDSCGTISKAADATGLIDLGAGSGTDCTTPGSGGAGNTHASRSGYYWLTAINEKARGFYPSNTWLNAQVTSNMNLNQTCNAYWNGSTVNFFRSGGGCGNTGEIPAIFLHEWGHGWDSNDGVATADMATGEAMGDTMAMSMTHVSCVGGGFLTSNCSGYGDACTACTGVRDIDYTKRSSGTKWNRAKVLSNCPADSSYAGPWGKEGHCESYPQSQGNWDLTRALITKYGDAGWMVFDKLWYSTRGNTSKAYGATNSGSGYACTSTNWYPAFLAANDDDGNLANGTPDAQQIFDAFSPHDVACTTQVHTSTVSGPTISTTPTVSGSGTTGSAVLSWGAVTGATGGYAIYRNPLGTTFGYTKIGTSTTTSYTDSQVVSGVTYYYAVQAAGATSSSFSQLGKVTVTIGGTAPVTYSISGTAGTPSASISVGSASTTADTTTSGAYTLAGLANGTYTVTPSKSGCTFSPTSLSVTISSANQTGKNFTATCGGGSTDTALTSGVAVTGQSVATGAWMYYYIDVPANSTNLVMATTAATTDLDIYTQFNAKPTSTTYTCRPYGSTGNETCTQANPSAGRWWIGVYGYAGGGFTVTATVTGGTTTTYSIAGNAGTSGVLVTAVSGATTKTATSDAASAYSIASLAAGTWTLTPSKTGCTFSPTTLSVTVGPNATGKNFAATCGTSTYSIAGTAGTGGVLVNAVGPATASATADASGNYSIVGLANGTYTVTPSKANCTFSPTSLSVTIASANQTGKNFTATCGSTGDTVLTSGVAVSSSVTLQASKYYSIVVPVSTTSLTVTLTGLSADIDLYGKAGAKPGTTSGTYDKSSTNGNTTSETISWTSPAAGTYWMNVYGYAAGNFTITATTVGGTGGGATAAYDATAKAPKCATAAVSCDSGTLLVGRSTKGPEPNYPNNIGAACADGTSGTFHSDESCDKIKVETVDGTTLAGGKQIKITVTVWAYGTTDALDLYFSSSATTPSWTLIGTQAATTTGAVNFTATYTLPAGAGAHAVRAHFRYNGSVGTCPTNSGYDESDDLIFTVQ
jgi:hypothetical protein